MQLPQKKNHEHDLPKNNDIVSCHKEVSVLMMSHWHDGEIAHNVYIPLYDALRTLHYCSRSAVSSDGNVFHRKAQKQPRL